jgi:hypothetical protein
MGPLLEIRVIQSRAQIAYFPGRITINDIESTCHLDLWRLVVRKDGFDISNHTYQQSLDALKKTGNSSGWDGSVRVHHPDGNCQNDRILVERFPQH